MAEEYCQNCGYYPSELGIEKPIVKNTEFGGLVFCNEECFAEWDD
jgi:hypothetical protein